ncbi:MAG: N5-glutamine S-adenosyl-L-methionine-dependent methyltransferase [Gammaproteobacteria bacterium]|nr:N5-glutamine S-adenosyl-L-methionine-dependent methyltransferase [Gammaproteobacteria bacterium]
MQTIASALYQAAQQFSLVTMTPALDAEVLLAYLLNVQRSYLHAHPERILSKIEEIYFADLIKQRAQGQPIAYLTGHCEFWSLDLMVTSDTLIPRPETELLVELILKKSNKLSCVVADLGTGSGAIALALARERPQWTIYATDSHLAALNIAKKNASRLKIKNIIFCHGIWCKALPPLLFDILVSNPPYVAENDPHLEQHVLTTEPASALLSGEDGLKDIRHIIHESRIYLKPKGYLLLEHGFSQAKAVRNDFLKVGYTHVISHQDFSGLNRVTTGIFGIE